ncbi:chaperone modulatory protein CbpM [Labrys wisconsinensis]|uniref:Chaperone modulatory protein CbpM n=2 Tax=Labrys wisconsinensis TaxID=425677 RepID=A0ABU0J9H8_9HYPH|nr:chaperone modulatory protein CbpM [Labrys wisconsinensis]
MTMDKQEFLASSGLEVQTLEFWIEQRWLIPEETAVGMRFSDVDMARARLIRELRHDFGANDAGIDVILHLMDQLHGMRRALAQLRGEIQGRSS